MIYYSGISLSNSINKVFDYVIIELHQNTLMSSGMQFAYKSQHSTSSCSVVYLETWQYYRQNGSQVYSCLLDASKAFDRIHYGELFNNLISRKLPVFSSFFVTKKLPYVVTRDVCPSVRPSSVEISLERGSKRSA